MPLLRSSSEPLDADQRLKNALMRNIEGAGGLLIIAIAAILAAALATWSVDDPSWSHATNDPIRNVLGEGGAVASDLAMQFVGLASVLIPLAPVFWGMRLINGSSIWPSRRALPAWTASIVLAAGFLACLPVSASWPLPLGLGGVFGDWILRIPLALFGEGNSQIVKMVAGLGLSLAAILCFFRSTGISVGNLRREAGKAQKSLRDRRKATKAARVAELSEFEDEEDDFDADPDRKISLLTRLSAGIGAVFHWNLSAKAQIRRMTGQRRPMRAAGPNTYDEGFDPDPNFEPDQSQPKPKPSWFKRLRENLLDPDDGLDGFYGQDRAEPAIGNAAAPQAQRAHVPQGQIPRSHESYDPHNGSGDYDNSPYGDAGDSDYEGDPYDDMSETGQFDDGSMAEPAPQAGPHPGLTRAHRPAALHAPGAPAPEQAAARVTAKAPPAKPGRRVVREAQGTFLQPEEYEFPPLHILSEPKSQQRDALMSDDALEQNARLLEGVLEDFGVRGEIINVRPGPVVTLYELEPAPGIKSSRVIGLADDIARSMSAISARVAVIPGKNAIGIELPNSTRETVYLRESLASEQFEKSKAKLALCLGKTIGGEPVIADLARMPHLLVAGTTGSGKSVAINTMIASLLYRLKPDECKLIMVDPKMLELSVYDGIPHLLTPVVTDPKKAVVALKWTVREMEDRYKKMSKLGVRNIDGYNNRVKQAEAKGEVVMRTIQTGFDRDTGEAIYEQEELDLSPMPFIVVIVDEMADLMIVAGKDIEGAIQRLAQMARAAGIHIIMATQRPSVDVITGTIKANFPTRMSFQVTSKIDSRTILGEMGAEQLLGMGDMLYMAGGGRIQRVHGPFVTDGEVEAIVSHLKTQGVPQYLESITDEDSAPGEEGGDAPSDGDSESGDLYEQAVAIVLRDKKASTSYVQRRLSIGYNRAASIIERMEQEGLIGPANHAGKREILVGGDEDI